MEVLSLISAPKYLEKQSSLIKKVEDTEVDTTELSAIKTFRPLFVFMVDFWAWFLNRKGFECYCIRTGSVQLDVSLFFLLFFLCTNFWLPLIPFYLWWFDVISKE